ncbi:MAG: alpha-L-rhamnosidase [Bacteroidales bacterium]|nr:alpha-L-rhamnosidase [Bacteroidales bacterium]
MKTFILLIILSIFLPGPRKPSGSSPTGLMVEFIREPQNVLIRDPKPEFSWIVPDVAGKQTAYQILVSSSEELLERNIGDLWNGLKTTGSQSTEVEYSGTALPANSLCHWKVRIWDKRSNPSPWSAVQSFRTGTFNGYCTTANSLVETEIRPETVTRTGNDSWFVDFGKAAFGKLVLELKPVRKDTLLIHIGEKLSAKNRIDRQPGGTIRYYSVALPVEPGKTRYVAEIAPDERNTGPAAIHLPDSFGVVSPFRYCEIEKLENEPDKIIQKALWHYFDDSSSSFISSDTILNRIWDISKYTIKATSFTGIYIDGDRERIPYEADAYINQLGHYYTDREYSMGRRTNEYFIHHPTWPTEWILQTVLMFHNDFMHTGNSESMARYYRELQYKTLSALARPDGLISSSAVNDEIMASLGFSNVKERIRDIVDWPPAQKDTGWKLATAEGERDGYDMREINTVVNAFYYRNLVLMSELAGHLGNPVDSAIYAGQAVKVKKVINEKLFDKKRGVYLDGEFSEHSSLHANMMALAFDLVPPEHLSSVIAFIKSRGMACSVYGAQFLLEGLFRAGEADYALSLLTATHDRSWWNMIKSGSTMTMEAWDMKYKPNSDWNHAWGAAPANIIPGFLWGISPALPGYSKATIRPQLSRLSYSHISVPTIRGNIVAEFRKDKESGLFIITIPANMDCDFVIDTSQYQTVVLNSSRVRPKDGILQLRPGTNRIEF